MKNQKASGNTKREKNPLNRGTELLLRKKRNPNIKLFQYQKTITLLKWKLNFSIEVTSDKKPK